MKLTEKQLQQIQDASEKISESVHNREKDSPSIIRMQELRALRKKIKRLQEFAENNIIEFIPVEGADHRFRNERKMETAIKSILDFYDL